MLQYTTVIVLNAFDLCKSKYIPSVNLQFVSVCLNINDGLVSISLMLMMLYNYCVRFLEYNFIKTISNTNCVACAEIDVMIWY